MSWSINYIGTPEGILKQLDKTVEAQNLTGPSKEEFEAALPAIKALVELNKDTTKKYISLSANGSKNTNANGEVYWSNANIKLENLYGLVVD